MQIKDFNHIVQSNKDKMFRIAFRVVKNEEVAKDVVQDALVKIWNKWESVKEAENPEAYCMTIVRNKAIDYFRSNKVTISELENHYDLQSGEATPDRKIIAKDEFARVRAFIDKLPENHRTVLELRDIEGYTYKEISEMTGYSIEKVKVYLFRARIRIKEHFKKMVS